mmetsp:Transcript_17460/g.47760  ORF Transcript_17460/g.47760 Transcript_17460/m.47760 type:complete len:284 (+) Transcript_17460:4391-5242(+)
MVPEAHAPAPSSQLCCRRDPPRLAAAVAPGLWPPPPTTADAPDSGHPARRGRCDAVAAVARLMTRHRRRTRTHHRWRHCNSSGSHSWRPDAPHCCPAWWATAVLLQRCGLGRSDHPGVACKHQKHVPARHCGPPLCRRRACLAAAARGPRLTRANLAPLALLAWHRDLPRGPRASSAAPACLVVDVAHALCRGLCGSLADPRPGSGRCRRPPRGRCNPPVVPSPRGVLSRGRLAPPADPACRLAQSLASAARHVLAVALLRRQHGRRARGQRPSAARRVPPAT